MEVFFIAGMEFGVSLVVKMEVGVDLAAAWRVALGGVVSMGLDEALYCEIIILGGRTTYGYLFVLGHVNEGSMGCPTMYDMYGHLTAVPASPCLSRCLYIDKGREHGVCQILQ